MKDYPHICEVQCSSARDFFRKINEIVVDPPWGERRRDRWAFRGQVNTDWRLVPSAFRAGTKLGYGKSKFVRNVTGRDLQSYEQGQAEFYAVYQFLQLADRVGLSVPGDNPLFRLDSDKSFVVGKTIGICDWPPPEVFEALAIAQHHGVPTRLLDFTYSYRVATWFCANKVAMKYAAGDKTHKMAVWALDMDVLFIGAENSRKSPFRKVTVPRAHNSYLHAQQGFFLLCSRASELGDPPCFETVIEGMMDYYRTIPADDRWPGLDQNAQAGYKFVIDSSEASALLDLRYVEGIDEAHVYPSLDSFVRVLASKGYN